MLLLLIFLAVWPNFVSPNEAPPTFQISPVLDISKLKFVTQDSIYCASEYHNGDFKTKECKNDISKGIINTCIYMVIPSTETEQVRYIYDCPPLSHLPANCSNVNYPFKRENYYYQWTTINYNGSRVSGALSCCGNDYCNESEEPPISSIRLVSEQTWADKAMDSFPYIFWTIVVIVCVSPQFTEHVDEKCANGIKRGETAEALPSHVKDTVEFKQQDQPGTVKAIFQTIRQLNHVLKEIKRVDKNEDNHSDEEDGPRPVQFSDIIYNYKHEEHKVKNVGRIHLSHRSSLAEQMIEHGPYEFNFNLIELAEMFDTVSKTFEKDATIMDLPNDIFVIGNMEGSYGDLFRWFNLIGWPPQRKVLFLGGLTTNDEKYSLETIALICALKLKCPDSVFVLRGGSECSPMDLTNRFPRRIAIALSDVILRTCHHLPLAATIDKKIFCSHGGIPINLKSLSSIANIDRPITQIQDLTIEADLILSVISNQNALVPGSRAHMFDPCSYEFDKLARKLGITYFIRSRNPAIEGHQMFGCYLLSIWSAPGKKSTTAATVVHINKKNLMTLLRFRVDTSEQNPMAGSVNSDNKIATSPSINNESKNIKSRNTERTQTSITQTAKAAKPKKRISKHKKKKTKRKKTKRRKKHKKHRRHYTDNSDLPSICLRKSEKRRRRKSKEAARKSMENTDKKGSDEFAALKPVKYISKESSAAAIRVMKCAPKQEKGALLTTNTVTSRTTSSTEATTGAKSTFTDTTITSPSITAVTKESVKVPKTKKQATVTQMVKPTVTLVARPTVTLVARPTVGKGIEKTGMNSRKAPATSRAGSAKKTSANKTGAKLVSKGSKPISARKVPLSKELPKSVSVKKKTVLDTSKEDLSVARLDTLSDFESSSNEITRSTSEKDKESKEIMDKRQKENKVIYHLKCADGRRIYLEKSDEMIFLTLLDKNGIIIKSIGCDL